jgi:thymidylate synthase (FAD)
MSQKIMMPDGIGFVECLEKFGDDLTVVNAARVSFDKVSYSLTEGDKKLINYLAKHDHVSPFFHPQVRFRIKMPIFCAREWFRHSIGFSRNEVSRRYVDFTPECWIPAADEIRERDPKLKQGSKSTPVENAENVHNIIAEQTGAAIKTYTDLLAAGVAPEVARGILPQSMYTEFIETSSLFGYARLCNLRLDPGAQKEIRDYATLIHKCMTEAFPVSWEALSSKFKGTLPTQTMSIPPPIPATRQAPPPPPPPVVTQPPSLPKNTV